MQNSPAPLEQTDPELAQLIEKIANKTHNSIKGFAVHKDHVIIFGLNGQIVLKRFQTPNRNDCCYCGSGKKFKHCCINK